jgi:hypothetical protein
MGSKTVFLFIVFALIVNRCGAQSIYFAPADLSALEEAVDHQNTDLQPYLNELRLFADAYLRKGPWSVTYIESKAVSGDPHDYYSEGPYWWPDPDDPEAPYIRRDGMRNPERFTAHKEALAEMTVAVSVLSLAGHYLKDPVYSKRAVEVLRVWFLDPETRMNPNLNYAQAIPNRSPGRNFGIIDTHIWAAWFDFLQILSGSGYWPEKDQDKLRLWFADYLNWMLESDHGQDEKMADNNHATWWTAQTAALAGFTDRADLFAMIQDHVKDHLIENQIESNGGCPAEEKRTRSFDYSLFNLEAFGLICRFFDIRGVDLWEWTNSRGGSVKKAIDYMVPYLENPADWKGTQITEKNTREPSFLLFAGLRFPEAEYRDLYRRLMSWRSPDDLKFRYDPFRLWLTMYNTAATKE